MKLKHLFGGLWMVAVTSAQWACTHHNQCPSGLCVDGICKDCGENALCQDPRYPQCRSGVCAECLQDSECPSDRPRCSSRYSCMQCASDADCASNQYCSGGDCRKIACHVNEECSEHFACVNHQCECAEECCFDANCPGHCGTGSTFCYVKCENYKCVCFAPTSTVSIATPEGGEDKILISQLSVNDRVLTGSGDFKKVIAFSTFSPFTESGAQQGSQYMKITLESSTFLELTPSHMIYVEGKKYPIEASNVRIGDRLIRKSPHTPDIMEKVMSVDYVYLQGGFAPITEDGTIVVNGFLASCYSNPAYQTSEYVTILGIPVLHRQIFTHMLKSPVRLFCKYISDSPCQVKDTLVTYKMPGHELVDKAHELAVIWGMEDLGEVVIGTIALAFFLVEKMLAHTTLLATVGLLFVLHRIQHTHSLIDELD